MPKKYNFRQPLSGEDFSTILNEAGYNIRVHPIPVEREAGQQFAILADVKDKLAGILRETFVIGGALEHLEKFYPDPYYETVDHGSEGCVVKFTADNSIFKTIPHKNVLEIGVDYWARRFLCDGALWGNVSENGKHTPILVAESARYPMSLEECLAQRSGLEKNDIQSYGHCIEELENLETLSHFVSLLENARSPSIPPSVRPNQAKANKLYVKAGGDPLIIEMDRATTLIAPFMMGKVEAVAALETIGCLPGYDDIVGLQRRSFWMTLGRHQMFNSPVLYKPAGKEVNARMQLIAGTSSLLFENSMSVFEGEQVKRAGEVAVQINRCMGRFPNISKLNRAIERTIGVDALFFRQLGFHYEVLKSLRCLVGQEKFAGLAPSRTTDFIASARQEQRLAYL
jgi:hypothetical protein